MVVLAYRQTQAKWDRMEGPQINPGTDGPTIFDKSAKANEGKDSFLNKWGWEN